MVQLSTGKDGGVEHNEHHLTLNSVSSDNVYDHTAPGVHSFNFTYTPNANTITATLGWSD